MPTNSSTGPAAVCSMLWALADASRQQLAVGPAAPESEGVSAQALTVRQQVHAAFMNDALLATSRFAATSYGVTTGRRARFVDGAGEQWEFVVDFLRPTRIAGQDAMACSGLRNDGVRALLLLGYDARALPLCSA